MARVLAGCYDDDDQGHARARNCTADIKTLSPLPCYLIPLPRCLALEIQHKQIATTSSMLHDISHDELACCPLQLPIVSNMANLSDDTLHKVRSCSSYTMVRAVS